MPRRHRLMHPTPGTLIGKMYELLSSPRSRKDGDSQIMNILAFGAGSQAPPLIGLSTNNISIGPSRGPPN